MRDAVRVWDSNSLRPLTAPLPHRDVRFFGVAPDDDVVFTASLDTVVIWDAATSRPRLGAHLEGNLVFASIAFRPARVVTITADDKLAVSIWAVQPTLKRSSLLRHEDPPLFAEISPDGKRVLTVAGGSYHLWAADAAAELREPIESDVFDLASEATRFDSTGAQVLIRTREGFMVLDAGTGKTVFDAKVEDNIVDIRFSGDGKHVLISTLTRGHFGPCKIFDSATGRLERELGDNVSDSQMGTSAHWTICAWWRTHEQRGTEVWATRDGTTLQSFPSYATDLSPDGSTLFFQNRSGEIETWRLKEDYMQSGRKQGTKTKDPGSGDRSR